MSPEGRRTGLGVGLAVGVIAGATLLPAGSGSGAVGGVCILCGDRGFADFLLNVALFTPLGAALATGGRSLLAATLVGAAFSLGIEVAQVFVIAGRDASVGDLLANTLGAGMGWSVLRLLLAVHGGKRLAAPLLPASLAVAAVMILLGGLWLMTPSFPDRLYYLQWTAAFEDVERYRGDVLMSAVGGLDLPGPPGPIQASDSVRALLAAGAPVSAVIRAGPPPEGLAPILGIYDDRQREILMVGADGADLVHRSRLTAQRFRLDRADIRFPDLLAGLEPGAVVDVRISPGTRAYCAAVGTRTRCVRGFTPGDTRMLLYYREEWTGPVLPVLRLIWLAVLFFPAGLVGRRWRHRTGALLIAGVALPLAPWLLGFPLVPLPEVAAAAAGVLCGGVLAHRIRWPRQSVAGRR